MGGPVVGISGYLGAPLVGSGGVRPGAGLRGFRDTRTVLGTLGGRSEPVDNRNGELAN